MRYLYCLLFTGCLFAGHTAAAQEGQSKSSEKSSFEEKQKLALYPLTANDYINIYVEWEDLQPFTIGIYDSKDLLQKEWKEAAKSYQKALNLEVMPPGRYYVLVKGEKEVLKKDFVISRTEK